MYAINNKRFDALNGTKMARSLPLAQLTIQSEFGLGTNTYEAFLQDRAMQEKELSCEDIRNLSISYVGIL